MASKTLSSLKTCKFQSTFNHNLVILPRLFSKSSSVVVQSNQVDTPHGQDGAKDAYKNKRDVPFMFLPHSVKKAYHVHETSLTLPKIFDKYKWLSKTISTPDLPLHHVSTIRDDVVNNELLKGFRDSLFHTVAYVKGYKNQKNARYVPERINFSLFTNFLRLSMGFGDDAIHLRPENSFLYHQPLLETHWPRNYKFYQTKFRPTFVLRTRNGFNILEEPEGKSRVY